MLHPRPTIAPPRSACGRLSASYLGLARLLHSLQHQITNLCWAFRNDGTRLLQRLDFVTSSTLSARDDGSGVSHPPAWGRCSTSNESDDGLVVRVVGSNVFCGIFFHGTTDFTNKDETFGLWVGKEDLDNVNVLSSGEGVTSDSDG